MPELIEVRFKGNRKDLYTWEQAAQLAIADTVPDLILLDHILAEGDLGLDYLPEFKDLLPHVPIVPAPPPVVARFSDSWAQLLARFAPSH